MKNVNQLTKTLAIALTAVTVSLISSLRAQAHGEDKPGPHGGEVRMPGAFHTEVKQRGREFEIYLLDIMFKDPQTADSSVEVSVRSASQKENAEPMLLSCRTTRAAHPPHFVCHNPKYKAADGDVLKVKAKRLGQVGQEVEYKLPLLQAKKSGKSAEKPNEKKSGSAHDHGHGNHHKGHGEAKEESGHHAH